MVREPTPVQIGDRLVGLGQPVFIIAEIGINHNGCLEIAQQLIDVAKHAGADAVKFQTRTVDIVYTEEELNKPRTVPRAILERAIQRGVLPREATERLTKSDFDDSRNGDLKRALELTMDEYVKIDEYCRQREILWFTSCWDCESVRRMEQFQLPCHKIASACNEDDELLREMRKTRRPIILSTGMTDLAGIHRAVDVLGTEDLIIFHCTSIYPTGLEAGNEILRHINLRGMDTLRAEFPGIPIGFSSHDSGIQPSYAAVALGAVAVEKHITLEQSMFGSDQASAVEPIPFSNLCRMVREFSIALGNGEIVVYPDEKKVEKKLRRVRRMEFQS